MNGKSCVLMWMEKSEFSFPEGSEGALLRGVQVTDVRHFCVTVLFQLSETSYSNQLLKNSQTPVQVNPCTRVAWPEVHPVAVWKYIFSLESDHAQPRSLVYFDSSENISSAGISLGCWPPSFINLLMKDSLFTFESSKYYFFLFLLRFFVVVVFMFFGRSVNVQNNSFCLLFFLIPSNMLIY